MKDIPAIGLRFAPSHVVSEAVIFASNHCDAMTLNHSIRSAYWAAIIFKKLPSFTAPDVDLEAVFVSCILHDMGWAKTEALLSKDKRFEVDGANTVKIFLLDYKEHNPGLGDKWDQNKVQRCWDAIALHTTPSIAGFAAAEVRLTHMGIKADFMGPAFPNGPGMDSLITMDEYRCVMEHFPRSGFTTEGLKQVLCGLCRSKPASTYDNFVGDFGVRFGIDGRGSGRGSFAEDRERNQAADMLLSGLASLEELDKGQ